MARPLKKTDYEVRDILKNNGLKWIGGEYTGSNNRTLTCLNSNGYIVVTSVTHALDGKTPRVIHSSNPFSKTNLYAKIDELGLGYEILSEYETSSKKLKCKTKEGYIILIRPTGLLCDGVVGEN